MCVCVCVCDLLTTSTDSNHFKSKKKIMVQLLQIDSYYFICIMLEVGYWSSLASSADGTKLVALSRDMFWFSSNAGRTWTKSRPDTGLPFYENGRLISIPICIRSMKKEYTGKVVSSADGSMLALSLCHGGVFTSNNSGASWTKRTNGLPKVTYADENMNEMYMGETTY